MKKELICPKCDCRVFWHVPVMQGANRPLPLWIQFNEQQMAPQGTGGFEAFVCRDCGYAELYAAGWTGLKEDPARGIRMIDNEPKAGLR